MLLDWTALKDRVRSVGMIGRDARHTEQGHGNAKPQHHETIEPPTPNQPIHAIARDPQLSEKPNWDYKENVAGCPDRMRKKDFRTCDRPFRVVCLWLPVFGAKPVGRRKEFKPQYFAGGLLMEAVRDLSVPESVPVLHKVIGYSQASRT